MDTFEPQGRIDPTLFRQVMGCFATGVTVVTARFAGETRGMTANAFMSGSLEPPLAVVSVDKRAHMHGHLARARRFAVNILAEGQEPLARHFAGKPDPALAIAFADVDAIPTLADAVARITAELEAAHDCGDHTLYVGRVLWMSAEDRRPLLFYRSRYTALAPDG